MIKFQTKLVTVRLNDQGQLHGGSYPAIHWRDGTKEWWWNGKRSCTRKAAILYPNGSREAWLHGLRHCYFVPSVIGCYASDLRGETVEIRTGNNKDGYRNLTVKYPDNPLMNQTKTRLFHLFGEEMDAEEWFEHPKRIRQLIMMGQSGRRFMQRPIRNYKFNINRKRK